MIQTVGTEMKMDEIMPSLRAYQPSASDIEAEFLISILAADQPEDMEAMLADELFPQSFQYGEILSTHFFEADIETHPDLDEFCVDGALGEIHLLRFCGLFCIHYLQYGEEGAEYGPYAELSKAQKAFEQAKESRISG